MIVGIMHFRDKVKLLMEQQRFSAAEVAAAAGVSDTQLYSWLSTRDKDKNRKPTYPQLLKIARLFKVTMESLADDDMDPLASEPPQDEAIVMQVYRTERDEHGLDWNEATRRMRVPPDRAGLKPR